MIYKTCKVCSCEFEPKRSDSEYCSKSCKQTAYLRRKKGIEQNSSSEREGVNEFVFVDEYEAVIKYFEVRAEEFPFIFYCFLRRKLNMNASLDSVKKYIESIWVYDECEKIVRTKAYRDYYEEFLSKPGGIMGNKAELQQ